MPWIPSLETAMSNTVLSVKDLSVAFGAARLQVTDGVSFDIHAGEFFALVGSLVAVRA